MHADAREEAHRGEPQQVGSDTPGADEAGEEQDLLRGRVIQLAFGGDPRRFDEFVRVLADGTPTASR